MLATEIVVRVDDQREDGGIYDNVPWAGWGGYGAPGWHDCYFKIAQTLYQRYGDTRIIEEQFESMKKAVDFILDLNPDLELDLMAPITVEESEAEYEGINTATFMLAVQPPGSQCDIAPSWLVADATTHSKAELAHLIYIDEENVR